MLYVKEGFPEEGELVLCNVSKIQFHSVFVNIDEYRKQGMIHISEISPGRIRNIRDYVVEGKVVVCKVLRVDKKKGYIDLSLRRVTEKQKKLKIDEIKQEQVAEKIIEFMAKEHNQGVKELYKKISTPIFEKYDSLHGCFLDVVNGKGKLDKMDLDEETVKELTALIQQRIKKPEVNIKGDLILTSYAPDGVGVIKESIGRAMKKGGDPLMIKYVGAGKYSVMIKAEDYKTAEKVLNDSVNAALKYIEKNEGEGEFVREE